MAQYLRIFRTGYFDNAEYGRMLSQLAVAEAHLATKSSTAQEHFIAIVKELEKVYGFEFRYQEFPDEPPKGAKESDGA